MAITMKSINGITEKTPKHLLLDAGAFFKNFDVTTDTYESAKAKLIGATKGGGSFKAVPNFRSIEFDGKRNKTLGFEVIDDWEVSISAKVIETTKETIKLALGVATESNSTTPPKYIKIEGKTKVEDSDYLDNITWVGTLSGSEKPVMIQIFNPLSQKGLELGLEDKSEGVIELEFNGFFKINDLDTPPFAIFYPEVK